MFGTIIRLQKQLLNTCHELGAEVNTLRSAEGHRVCCILWNLRMPTLRDGQGRGVSVQDDSKPELEMSMSLES